MARFALLAIAADIAVAVTVAVCSFGAADRAWSGRPADASSPPSSPGAAEDSRRLGHQLMALSDPRQVGAAVARLRAAAERGDVEAEVALGKIYLEGLPAVPKNAALAGDYFFRAAATNHPSAAYFLGVMLKNGDGCKADPAAAVRWFGIAAQSGSPQAMFMLANAYRAGAGVPKSYPTALQLYQKAADLEHPAALQTLAMAYLRGELGLEPDESAYRRYSMEAEHAIQNPLPAP